MARIADTIQRYNSQERGTNLDTERPMAMKWRVCLGNKTVRLAPEAYLTNLPW